MGRILRLGLRAALVKLFGMGIFLWFRENPWIWWWIVGGAAVIVSVVVVAVVSAEAAASAVRENRRSQETSQREIPPRHDEIEVVFWESIAKSNDPGDFRAYLEQNPAGRFRRLAHNRIEHLGGDG
jgi:hypothetical protein